MKIQKFFYNNISVSFNEQHYLNATEIAKHFNKQVRDYLKTTQTQDYLRALAQNLSVKNILLTENDLVIVKQGGIEQGTWLHPKLAVNFARWLSADFAVWCDLKIDALMKGEDTPQSVDPMQMLNDPRTLRGLLDNYTEKVLVLEHKVEEMKPTVAAFDRIATKTEGSMCITDSAKHLGVKPKFLFDFLSSQKWIYKRPGNSNWIAYQDKLQQLLLEHKIHVAMRDDGTEKVCERVLITAKGLTKLAKIFELQQAA
ncbi:phage antirepressor KilAC domain-containing protein [Pasteurella multocida]|uniref:phage antirepressor KilAC domain-containing protein n=1 Tax=Pasteurella multocida TaxID=747 RepID=UPI002877330A|nr:phage antirepressor KilAC domain-containing protein [Pasteurella multocida]WND48698.1 phage antirepressor KilAC domain-containing protein [Pasteurella multocida]